MQEAWHIFIKELDGCKHVRQRNLVAMPASACVLKPLLKRQVQIPTYRVRNINREIGNTQYKD